MDERALAALLQWGSCDGCGRSAYCPICGSHREAGHTPKCPAKDLPEFDENDLEALRTRAGFR